MQEGDAVRANGTAERVGEGSKNRSRGEGDRRGPQRGVSSRNVGGHVGCSGEKSRKRWVHEGNSGTLEAVGWVHVVKGTPPRSSHSPVAATVV